MLRTKRFAVLLIAAMALPLLVSGESLAAGGSFPSFPGDPLGFNGSLHTSGQVTAVIVLDPNGPVSSGAPATPTGTFGSIAITLQNVGTAAATFQVEPGSSLGELRFGCNLLDTNLRFVEFSAGVPGLPFGGPFPFDNWLSSAVTAKLFAQLGIFLVDGSTVLRIPAIANVISQKCVPFPKANKTLDNLMLSEIIDTQKIKPLPPTYPDRTIRPAPIDPAQQWFPGFLVLEVTIGFWALDTTPTP